MMFDPWKTLVSRRPGFCMWPLGKATLAAVFFVKKCGGFLWRFGEDAMN